MLQTLRKITLACILIAAFSGCGDDAAPLASTEDELLATNHWECRCTCTTPQQDDDPNVSFDCSNCAGEGNQCKASEGGACATNGGEGTLSACTEFLARNPAPATLSDVSAIGDGP